MRRQLFGLIKRKNQQHSILRPLVLIIGTVIIKNNIYVQQSNSEQAGKEAALCHPWLIKVMCDIPTQYSTSMLVEGGTGQRVVIKYLAGRGSGYGSPLFHVRTSTRIPSYIDPVHHYHTITSSYHTIPVTTDLQTWGQWQQGIHSYKKKSNISAAPRTYIIFTT